MSYEQRLLEIGIILLEPFNGAKTHHSMKCVHCNHEWTATPLSKTQAYQKYGYNGCPECNRVRVQERNEITRQQNIQIVHNKGLIIESDWDGRNALGKNCTPILVTFRNPKCGHIFTCNAVNILRTDTVCTVCGKEERTSHINNWSKSNSEEWKKTADIWQKYKSKVTKLTKQSYKNNKHNINPNNLPIGRAGTEGAYHIDHIVPIRYCFEHFVSEEICAHPDNLQMLGWRENIGSRDKLKENIKIPNIFTGLIMGCS